MLLTQDSKPKTQDPSAKPPRKPYTFKPVPTPDGYISLKEFCRKHGLDRKYFAFMLSRWKIARQKIGRKVLFSEREALKAYNTRIPDAALQAYEVRHFVAMGYEKEFIATLLGLSENRVQAYLTAEKKRERGKDG